MGICGSALDIEASRSREVEDGLVRAAAASRRVVKLLLLGAGDAGKSTVFKQMRILFGRGYSEDERREYVPVIHSNTLSSIRTLVHNAQQLALDPPLALSPAARESASFIQSPPLAGGIQFDVQLAGHIAALWADPAIQRVHAQRARFQLIDSAA